MSLSVISADNGKHKIRLDISSEIGQAFPNTVGKLFKDG
jgi:hypothetical protein